MACNTSNFRKTLILCLAALFSEGYSSTLEFKDTDEVIVTSAPKHTPKEQPIEKCGAATARQIETIEYPANVSTLIRMLQCVSDPSKNPMLIRSLVPLPSCTRALSVARALLFARINKAHIEPVLKISFDYELDFEEICHGSVLFFKKLSPDNNPYMADSLNNKGKLIRYSNCIKLYFHNLFLFWKAQPPPDANDFFQTVFEHVQNLSKGGVFLDPRDVVFYMIFGEGISRYQGSLAPQFGVAMNFADVLLVREYIGIYETTEQYAFAEATKKDGLIVEKMSLASNSCLLL